MDETEEIIRALEKLVIASKSNEDDKLKGLQEESDRLTKVINERQTYISSKEITPCTERLPKPKPDYVLKIRGMGAWNPNVHEMTVTQDITSTLIQMPTVKAIVDAAMEDFVKLMQYVKMYTSGFEFSKSIAEARETANKIKELNALCTNAFNKKMSSYSAANTPETINTIHADMTVLVNSLIPKLKPYATSDLYKSSDEILRLCSSIENRLSSDAARDTPYVSRYRPQINYYAIAQAQAIVSRYGEVVPTIEDMVSISDPDAIRTYITRIIGLLDTAIKNLGNAPHDVRYKSSGKKLVSEPTIIIPPRVVRPQPPPRVVGPPLLPITLTREETEKSIRELYINLLRRSGILETKRDPDIEELRSFVKDATDFVFNARKAITESRVSDAVIPTLTGYIQDIDAKKERINAIYLTRLGKTIPPQKYEEMIEQGEVQFRETLKQQYERASSERTRDSRFDALTKLGKSIGEIMTYIEILLSTTTEEQLRKQHTQKEEILRQYFERVRNDMTSISTQKDEERKIDSLADKIIADYETVNKADVKKLEDYNNQVKSFIDIHRELKTTNKISDEFGGPGSKFFGEYNEINRIKTDVTKQIERLKAAPTTTVGTQNDMTLTNGMKQQPPSVTPPPIKLAVVHPNVVLPKVVLPQVPTNAPLPSTSAVITPPKPFTMTSNNW